MKVSKKISFAAFCADVIGESISPAWIAAYKAFDGEKLNPSELEAWRERLERELRNARAWVDPQ